MCFSFGRMAQRQLPEPVRVQVRRPTQADLARMYGPGCRGATRYGSLATKPNASGFDMLDNDRAAAGRNVASNVSTTTYCTTQRSTARLPAAEYLRAWADSAPAPCNYPDRLPTNSGESRGWRILSPPRVPSAFCCSRESKSLRLR